MVSGGGFLIWRTFPAGAACGCFLASLLGWLRAPPVSERLCAARPFRTYVWWLGSLRSWYGCSIPVDPQLSVRFLVASGLLPASLQHLCATRTLCRLPPLFRFFRPARLQSPVRVQTPERAESERGEQHSESRKGWRVPLAITPGSPRRLSRSCRFRGKLRLWLNAAWTPSIP